jgi:hypothetical protein
MSNKCIGDPTDDISEKRLIICEEWDQENVKKVKGHVLENMLRKVRWSVANGQLISGGQYLTIEQYAEALTVRIMNKRERLYGLRGDVRMRLYYQIDKTREEH